MKEFENNRQCDCNLIPNEMASQLVDDIFYTDLEKYQEIKKIPALDRVKQKSLTGEKFLAMLIVWFAVGLAYVFTISKYEDAPAFTYMIFNLVFFIILIVGSVLACKFVDIKSDRDIKNCDYCQNMLMTNIVPEQFGSADALVVCGYLYQYCAIRPVCLHMDRSNIRIAGEIKFPMMVNLYMEENEVKEYGYNVISNI